MIGQVQILRDIPEGIRCAELHEPGREGKEGFDVFQRGVIVRLEERPEPLLGFLPALAIDRHEFRF